MEQKIADRCWRDRMELPDDIQNAPYLEFGLELYYNAYIALNTCRQVGFGFAPIPWTAIDQYARAHDFADDQRLALEHYIRKMDNVLESWQEKRDGTKSRTPAVQSKNESRFRKGLG